MAKVMLVLENEVDKVFITKLLQGLQIEVIVMSGSQDMSEQLMEHFPDIVFASTLGRNGAILSTLGKIKKIRGKPKLVFVRDEQDLDPLSFDQQRIVDGVLRSPVDPLQMIEAIASTTSLDLEDLKQRYKSFKEGGEVLSEIKGLPIEDKEESKKTLVHDPERKLKYQKIVEGLANNGPHKNLDVDQLRKRQKEQIKDLKEDEQVEKNRKHFIKTLFAAKPKS